MNYLTRKLKTLSSYIKDLVKRNIDYIFTKPTSALLFMTYRCTSQCKMCTIWKRSKNYDKKKELTLNEWKKVIDTLNENNVKLIELFGGDSLIRKDVTIPIIEYIKKKNKEIIVDMPTNCNLLDEKTAISLVKSGLDRLYISLDGPIEIHDKIRGNKGTFNRVQKSLEHLVKAKKNLDSETPVIIVNCTISSSNVHHFEQIIQSIEKIGANGIDFEYVGEFKDKNIQSSSVNGIKPTPFYITLGESNLLNREQATVLKKKMKDIRKSKDKYKIFISTSIIDSLTINNLMKGTIPNRKCYISRNKVTIDPFGNLLGCFHYNNYNFGNIKELPFSSIWKNKKHRCFLKSQKDGSIQICKNCVSGINRNVTFLQSIYRNAYFVIKRKGFDEP